MIVERVEESTTGRHGTHALERLVALQEVTAGFSQVATQAEIAHVVLTKGAEALGVRDGVVVLVGADDGNLEVIGTVGFDGAHDGDAALARDAPPPVERAIRSNQPVFGDGVAALPLKGEGDALGGVAFSLQPGRRLDAEERAFCEALARQCAQALDRARLYEAERRARARAERLVDRTRRLERVTSRLARALSAGDIATAIIHEGTMALDATVGALWLVSEDGSALELVKSAGMPPLAERLFARIPRDVAAPIVDALARGEAIWLESRGDYAERYPASFERVSRLQMVNDFASACLPLSVDARPLGAITFSFTHARAMDADERSFMTVLSQHTALALERVRLFEAQQRTATRVQQAYASAKDAERRKDEFLAMLGHELRNPLAPIHTALQLLRVRGETALQRERTIIERQVRHLERLVSDLLDVSRITRGKIQLHRECLELADVVAKAVELTAPLVEQKRHRLIVEVPREGLKIEGDHVRLTQVVTNLLTNAAKYSEPCGEIRVDGAHEGGRVALRVKDRGAGMTAELLSHVFELFTQAPQTLARSEGGLGLGLTIARSLVQMHGGSIAAFSEGPGCGSELLVTLPASNAPAREADAVLPPSSGATAHAARVLVVDDNRDAAETLAEALAMEGHDVAVAFDGASALEMAARCHPEVVLLDIGLPVVDGYEVARRLRHQHAPTSLRLIAVTGYGQESDRARAAAAGFDEHMVKPVDLAMLLQALEHRQAP